MGVDFTSNIDFNVVINYKVKSAGSMLSIVSAAATFFDKLYNLSCYTTGS